jgi:predicted Zn-dependent peptidase
MHKKTTLKNGLRIITVPQKGTQAVTVLVLVGTGSKYEKKEISGISHFLEHMYFKGTRKRPSALAVSETLDKIGGIYNAFTSEEFTGYFAKVSAEKTDLALDWVSDIYLNSLLPKKEVEKERGVIIEELNMYFDTPMIYIGELWKTLLYGDQPAGWDIVGSRESVASNTIVCAAGKISASQMVNKIKDCFSGIKATRPTPKSLVVEKQKKPEVLLFQKKTDQTHLALGVRTFNLFHPQRYALELLAVILGGMMSSRLFSEVREKLGIAYYIKTNVDLDSDTGYLVTQAGVDNRKVDLAITTVLKEYKKISRKKILRAELKKAKDHIKGKMVLLLEASDARASFYAGQELLEGRTFSPQEIFKKIDKVTPNDILKVAGEVFQPKKLNLALIGPFKEKEKFKKLLNK